ncbi:MAG: DUF2807 domain-containing protein [Bacteroidia bacterium]|nr:DUF2807 domain-containing protein [Bacteroidia bacterium]
MKKLVLVISLLSAKIAASQTTTFTLSGEVRQINANKNIILEVMDSFESLTTISGNITDYHFENGVLELKKGGKITLRLPLSKVQALQANNYAKILVQGALESDSININAMDYAHIEVTLKCKKLNICSNDYAHLNIKGKSDKVILNSNDFSNADLSGMNAKEIYFESEDYSKLKLNSDYAVEGTSRDFSSVKIFGNPALFKVQSYNFSKINRNNESGNLTNDSLKTKNFTYGEHPFPEKLNSKKRKKYYGWQGVSLGINSVLNENNSFGMVGKYRFFEQNYSNSLNIQLNPYQQNFRIYSNKITLFSGIGVEWRIFRLQKNAILNADTSYFHGYLDTVNAASYKSSALRNFNIHFPFMFEFRFGEKNRFSFISGALVAWMIGSSQKLFLVKNNYEIEMIRKDNFNLNPLQFKLHASIGYRDFHFFSEYSLNGMFLKNKGPNFRLITFGIRSSFDYD